MGKANLSLVTVAVIRNEKQVIRRPGGPVRAIGGRASLQRDLAQYATERDDRKSLRLELDEVDAPRLARRERPQPFDLLDLGRIFQVDAEFIGPEVVKQIVDVFERVPDNR